jgi:hypothetical protein
MPLQLSLLEKMSLQKQDLEICHSNFVILAPMPFCILKENNGSKYTCISMCAVEFTIIPLFSTFGSSGGQSIQRIQFLVKTLNCSEKTEKFTENQIH